VANNVELSGVHRQGARGQKLTGHLLDAVSLKVGLTCRETCLYGRFPGRTGCQGGVLRLFDPESNVLVATGRVYGNFRSTGGDREELVRNLEGTIAMISRNGVIRKWNLLSKILGLLNVYDSFRGKVKLGQEGMPYTVTASPSGRRAYSAPTTLS
jgi:hypothetical protein